MPTILNNGIQLPDKGSVDWYSSMQSNYNLIDTHLGNTDTHVTAEDKANWNSKQGSLSQAQLDAIAQVSTNTSDIATLQSSKANASHTHSSSDITDIDDYATKQYVDNSISGLVDNAPDALNTLNELSAALNDDSNFASTVTNALATKANSADLATVATSGDYDDLSNKPSIPTNTSDLNNDSGFVTLNDFDIPSKISDLTNDSGFITSSDVPTSTSDLINDSNFVDTSNSAVASGITAAKVTSYDSHIADTDIHVTTADKTKWNNGVTQSYVFRYSGTAVVPNSTIAYSTIDNTDNIKVGDKCMDLDAKLFEITAVDTTNQTVTVGTALIDLALDANVVHTSGNETVGGQKTFTNSIILQNSDTSGLSRDLFSKSQVAVLGDAVSGDNTKYRFVDKNDNDICYIRQRKLTNSNTDMSFCVNNIDNDNNSISAEINFVIDRNNEPRISPSVTDSISLGRPTFRWKSIYSNSYYYGNVEFSTKFVTTDTSQTIIGNKTFGNGTLIVDNTTGSNVHGEIKFNGSRPGYITADNASDGVFDSTECGVSILLQDFNKPLHIGRYKVDSNGRVFADNTNKNPVLSITGNLVKTSILVPENDTVTTNVFRILSQIDYANGNTSKFLDVRFVQYDNAGATSSIYSNGDNKTTLGVSSRKWSDVLTYKVNGLTPSSLGMPVIDRTKYVDISGYFTNTGNGDINTYSVTANGWVYLRLTDIGGCQLSVLDSSNNRLYGSTSSGNLEQLCLPVTAGTVVETQWTTSTSVTVAIARFIPCQGNI